MINTEIRGMDAVREAGEIIKSGGIVAFPTETVYGLGADAFNENAVKGIFAAKGRPQDNPLIVHIHDVSLADEVAEVTAEAKKLFERFSPGPLTLVLKKKEAVPDSVTAGLSTVGVRIPSHPLALAFLKAVGRPVAAPSANISSRISPTSAKHVFEDMNGKIPLILDGGSCEVGIESTVLDLTKDIPVILRPGSVTAEMLLQVLSDVAMKTGEVAVAESPGMKYKHYAPAVPCVGAVTMEGACSKYDEEVKNGRKPVIICLDMWDTGGRKTVYLGKNSSDYARNIYGAMRDAEKVFDLIIVQILSGGGLDFSVMNRINKSTQGERV